MVSVWMACYVPARVRGPLLWERAGVASGRPLPILTQDGFLWYSKAEWLVAMPKNERRIPYEA